MKLTTEKKIANDIPNLFEKRLEMLHEGYTEQEVWKTTTIGIPRALMVYYQQFPSGALSLKSWVLHSCLERI